MAYTYATPEIKKTRAFQRAERLEREVAPRAWETPGLTNADLEVLADAWEEAGFLGWADNYRAATRRRVSSRDPARISRSKQKWISEKIRILRHEGYPPRQAVAIAYRMAGVPRRRASQP